MEITLTTLSIPKLTRKIETYLQDTMIKTNNRFWVSATVLLAILITSDLACAVNKKKFTIQISTSSPAASFTPNEAFGAGLDGLEEIDFESTYSPENIKAMLGAPYRRLSYRLRPELGIEAWHWNEAGSWSNEAKKEGYWTSNDTATSPLLKSYGYRLPRRGSTIDQAGNDSYSRLDDGDEHTFWKSNPYLDAYYTGEDNALHPQWVVIDLGQRRNINTLRILWGEPYATRYEVQYWEGKDSDTFNKMVNGDWRSFKRGRVQDGKGGNTILPLGDTPVSVRFVRILLQASSGKVPQNNEDVRDHLGYAIREVFIGVLNQNGKLQDIIRHSPSNKSQTMMTVSSTDPWHRAIDRNPKTTQPGFDRIMASGLGRGDPILTPVSMMYDTPENTAAEIRFLKSRGFPIRQIELGEEPDGQNVTPEHYGALYLQFSKVIHDIDPTLVTGGPGLQSEVIGWNTFPDKNGERSWMKRFLNYLRIHNRIDDFGFFTFEWYPFDDLCKPPAGQLIEHPSLLKKTYERLDGEGVPHNIPWIISEYGFSAFAGRAEVELPAALLNAEIVAQFLTLGGKAAYYYGLEPNEPIRELNSCSHPDRLWGNLMMFQKGPNGKAKWRLPAYYGGKMLMEEWAEPTNAPHQLFPAVVWNGAEIIDNVTAYVVRRPDNHWAIMVLNKSAVSIELGQALFDGPSIHEANWNGPLDVIQYSPRQYNWRANGNDGQPTRSEPPERFKVVNGFESGITLPAMSLTVVRGTGL